MGDGLQTCSMKSFHTISFAGCRGPSPLSPGTCRGWHAGPPASSGAAADGAGGSKIGIGSAMMCCRQDVAHVEHDRLT